RPPPPRPSPPRRRSDLADSETLARRAADGHGLTRPELAVLLSSSKLVLQAAIEASDLGDDDDAVPLLLGDFPAAMQGPFRKRILDRKSTRLNSSHVKIS